MPTDPLLRVWLTNGGTAPSPIFVEADEIFDGVKERDDHGGPDAYGGPLVDDTGDVLRAGAFVYGDNPSVRKHQDVNHGESGSIKNDRSDVAEADPIGLRKVDARADDCGEHDENGRQI